MARNDKNADDFLSRRDEILYHLKSQLDVAFAADYELFLVGFEIQAGHPDKGPLNIELAINWNPRVSEVENGEK